MRYIIIAISIVVIVVASAIAYQTKPQPQWPGTLEQSFSECMLEQMRGVPGNLAPFAVDVCKKRLQRQEPWDQGSNPFDQFDDKPNPSTSSASPH